MGYRLVHHREIPGGKLRVAIGEGAGQDDAQFQAVMVMLRNRPTAGDAQKVGTERLRDRQIERRERWPVPGSTSHVSDIRWPS